MAKFASTHVNKGVSRDSVLGFLRTKEGNQLYHRESRTLEFKETFNFAGLADYFKDFAAFANNIGGFIVFGVTNSPREPRGLSDKSADMFERIDEAKISEFLNDLFVPSINWDRMTLIYQGKHFGAFYIHECVDKPVIAKKDEGEVIRNGEIYYRYAGRSEKILFAELNAIIQKRLDLTNQRWLDLMSQVARIGPANVAILDTDKGLIQEGKNQTLLIDESLIPKLQFVRDAKLDERSESTALRLVGDVTPVNTIEVTKIQKKSLLELYPLSCADVIAQVKGRLPAVKQGMIHQVIKENDLKRNESYSAFVFRNRRHAEKYRETGEAPKATTSIYNQNAVEFLVKVLRHI